jgi:hypothetical protein
MSLDEIMNRRKRKRSVSPESSGASGGSANPMPNPNQEGPKVEPQQGSAAVIPEDRAAGLNEIVKTFSGNQNQTGKTFSMNELLKMDDSQKGLPEILGVPIGAQENDMYRILERCRLTKHEKQVYVQAIHFAEHGLGYSYKSPNSKGDGIKLDFTVPFYGDYIVKQLRGSVSVDGESLGVFERTVSTWVARLYATQQNQQQQAQRGIIQ